MSSADAFCLEFGDQDFSGGIPQRFERVVERFGSRIALIDDLTQMTYAELNAAANQLAHWLLMHWNQVDAPIALFFGHQLSGVVALLGVLKAGKIYCALDVSSPVKRNLVILEDLGCQLILTDEIHFAQAEALTNGVRQAVDLSTATHRLSTNPQVEIYAPSLAAISYTSGSTGTPKGVVRTHWYYLKRAQLQVEFLETVATDTLSMLNSLCFGSSASDLYAAILSGAALCFYNTRQMGVTGVTAWIQKHQVTQLHLPNTSLRAWLDTVPEDLVFQSLNNVRPSFRLYGEDIQRLWQHLPAHATIMHALSATETGPVCRIKLHRDTPLEGTVVPVGYPIPGVEILLLDDEQPVPPGEVGEIYVCSPYTHRYWRQPEHDDEKVANNPLGDGRRFYRLGDLGRIHPNGMLELVGRKDFQVKIRGYRVEIEEVEIALEKMEGVRQAVVIARSGTLGEKQLVAYVVPVAAGGIPYAKLRADLRTILPDYAIPARFLFIDHLPLINGKVDRASLPPPGRSRPDLETPFVAPRNELEQQIAHIWADLLEVDEVGVEDNFFELGGDSILAMRMALAVEQATGGHVPPDYFRNPTIAALAPFCAILTNSHPEKRLDVSGFARWAGPTPVHRQQSRRRLPSAGSLIRWMMRRRLLRLGYWEGMDWLNFFGQPFLAGKLFGTEHRQLQDLSLELGSQAAIGDVMRASIIGNTIRGVFRSSNLRQNTVNGDAIAAMQHAPEPFWRDIAANVAAGGERSGRRLYQLDGLEHLLHAHRRGRGIILLTYHNTGSVLGDAILAHLTSLGRVPTLSLERALTVAEQDEDDDGEAAQMASQWAAAYSLQAQRILRAGGIVRISNDMNYSGSNSISRTIGKRRFWLKPGFADLALSSGAAIIPVYSYIDYTGCIYLKVQPALSMLATASSRTAQIHHRLDQYVDFLETAWREHPESMGWGLLGRYHQCPRVDLGVGESGKL